MFDADEYLHLAMHASSVGNHHACMMYLKELLQQQPEHAVAIYLLALEHAKLGLLERAVSGLRASLAIRPELEIARFQLGMLLLDRNQPVEAKAQFAALSGCRDPGLRAFCQAMCALADDQPEMAREKLVLGLSQPVADPALSAAMKRLFDKLAKVQPASANEPETPGEAFLLGAYRNTLL